MTNSTSRMYADVGRVIESGLVHSATELCTSHCDLSADTLQLRLGGSAGIAVLGDPRGEVGHVFQMDRLSKPLRVSGTTTLPGYRPLLYIDPEAIQRDFADAVFRGEYAVESVASIEEVDDRVEVAVIVINLSEAADPNPAWEKLTRRWPSAPVVVVLSSEAAVERDREALWVLGPASIVVNPLAPGALRNAVAAALS